MSHRGSRSLAAYGATTPAGRECHRRCVVSFASIRWPTISMRCSITSGSPARSRLRVSLSVVRSPFISPPDTRSAPAPSRSAARRPASRRIAAPRRSNAALERVAKIEAVGMAFAVEDAMQNGYAPELRGDFKRFERYRARWCGNDPSSYATIWRMLVGADMQDELTTLRCPVLVIGGTLDRVRPPPLPQAVASAIPGARYVEVRTSQYMAVQKPDLIFDCVDAFLKETGA